MRQVLEHLDNIIGQISYHKDWMEFNKTVKGKIKELREMDYDCYMTANGRLPIEIRMVILKTAAAIFGSKSYELQLTKQYMACKRI